MYFVRRILFAIPLLLIISAIAFALVRLAPGGPFDRERAHASPEVERNLQAKYHLDEPGWKQFVRYIGFGYALYDVELGFNADGSSYVKKRHFIFDENGKVIFKWFGDGVVEGNLGPSLKYRNHTVNDIIAQGLPVSLTLGILAFGFAMGIGLPLGFITAAKRGRWPDVAGSILAILVVCIPSFVISPLLILGFAIKSNLLPVALWESPMHMILPTIALGLYFAGKIARLFREGMLSAMQSEFVTAARSKGLGENALLLKHAVRIAILPVVSYSGPMLADLLTGSFIVENIFQIPGIGVFLVNSSTNLDYTVVVGLALLYAILLIGLNLIVDFTYTLLDPRVKYE